MQREPGDLRRLRFPVDLEEGESIPGAIARGVRDHVLVRTRPVLDAAGVAARHAGHCQVATKEEVRRLARVIGCDPARLSANLGERLAAAAGARSAEVRFGDHTLPRIYLELNRRRISPASLRRRNYHRLEWMNLLLPYCPESLERLVSSCADCGSTIGWHYAKGIGICEFCDCEITPAAEPGLPQEHADDYRLFAALSSPSGRNASATAAMPPAMRAASSATLLRLALQLGGLVQEDPVKTASPVAVLGLTKPLLATVIVSGTALLRSWPHGFQTWVADRSDKLRSDPDALGRLRSSVRGLTAPGRESDLINLVVDALPNLKKHSVHGFSSDRRYYLYKDVQKRLGLDNAQIAALRKWDGIKYLSSGTTSAYQKGQFDADQIDRLAPLFRDSVPFKSCTGRFKLPLYGVEQCCRPGMLERECDPVFNAIKSRTSVRPASLKAFQQNLIAARCRRGRPSDTVSLAAASRRIGGRLKPWGSMFEALLDKRVCFWLKGLAPTTKSIFVRACELSVVDMLVDEPSQFGVDTSTVVSQADAAEILNLKSELLPALSDTLRIPFTPSGLRLETSRNAVLEAAAATAWNPEISHHLGVRFHQVEDMLIERKIARRATGWCRRQLVEEGILPGQPGKRPVPLEGHGVDH